jgi:hypothetical protein
MWIQNFIEPWISLFLIQKIYKLFQIHVIRLALSTATSSSQKISYFFLFNLHGPEQLLDVISGANFVIEGVELVESERLRFDHVVFTPG